MSDIKVRNDRAAHTSTPPKPNKMEGPGGPGCGSKGKPVKVRKAAKAQ